MNTAKLIERLTKLDSVTVVLHRNGNIRFYDSSIHREKFDGVIVGVYSGRSNKDEVVKQVIEDLEYASKTLVEAQD